jgi:predicted phosphohydrolase
MPKIVLISDTHNLHSKITIPECDILIHAGDATGRGTLQEVSSFLYWLSQQPAKHKVAIAGNHDWLFDRDPFMARNLLSQYSNITMLNDELKEVMGLKIYGSPVTPRFFDWAFNADEDDLYNYINGDRPSKEPNISNECAQELMDYFKSFNDGK